MNIIKKFFDTYFPPPPPQCQHKRVKVTMIHCVTNEPMEGICYNCDAIVKATLVWEKI